ncbi:MAG: sigma-54-dependent transcriptional regulator [Vicinamibacterales bacterium]
MLEFSRSRTLLVVDSDPAVLTMVDRCATDLGFAVIRETNGRAALDALPVTRPDGAIVDLAASGLDGFALLREIKAADPQSQVILMTGAASLGSAIDAIKAGALDYITKPLDPVRLSDLLLTVRKSLERRETLLRIDADVARQFEFYGLIGRSPGMQELFDAVRRFAPYARTVLVTGETGTGKELVAKALHRLGPRRERRLITVNCSAVVETLFESELFGHVRGAFTGATDTKVGLFEHADSGTIFLDEIGELPLTLQAKLLRAVELGEVQRVGSLETRRADVFAIAATNRDLRSWSAAGKFRSDLYFRLSTIELKILPLRDRREDIPYLTAAFVREFATKLNRPIKGIAPGAERLLQNAAWPGNVRELRNVIERACILTDNRIITERELTLAMTNVPDGTGLGDRQAAPGLAAAGAVPVSPADPFGLGAMYGTPPPALPSDDSLLLSTAQREQILRALRQVGGNKAAAAKRLGVSRRSLYRWLERLGIPQ